MNVPVVRGKRVVVGFVALVVVAVVGAILTWYARKDPHGPELARVEADRGAVVLRLGYEERGYVHLMRVDDAGETLWSEALYGIEDDPALTLTDELVLVRAREARGHAELHAFRLDDGRFAWRGGRNRYESPEGNPTFTEHPLWVHDDVVYYVHASEPREVVVIRLDDGEELGRVELSTGTGPTDAELIDGELRVEPGDGEEYRVNASAEIVQ